VKSARLRFALRALLSCGLIALLLSRLDWSEVVRLIHGVYLVPLAAGAAIGVLGELLMAERTRLMLAHWTVRLTRRAACSVTWVGQFCNNFLPGGMGGDMVKFYRIGRLFPHARAATLVALIADRLLALTALVAISLVALSVGDRGMLRLLVTGTAFGAWRSRLPAWWVAALLALGSAAFIALLVWRFRRAILERGAAHLRSVCDALRQGSHFDAQLVGAFFLAVAVHSLGMLGAWSFAHALAIPLGLSQTFLVWPVVLVAMMMPISVNGHGLREFILIYYFERWHLTSHLAQGAGTKESVVALSLFVVVSDLLCNVPGGLLLLASDRQPSPDPADTPGQPPAVASAP
jgi:uncharacterized membrane protein YbhN (UPF0104 family)